MIGILLITSGLFFILGIGMMIVVYLDSKRPRDNITVPFAISLTILFFTVLLDINVYHTFYKPEPKQAEVETIGPSSAPSP